MPGKSLKSILPMRLRRELKYVALRASCRGDFKRLCRELGTDKHGGHFYAQHYEQHFKALRKKRLKLLEIGIGGDSSPTRGGNSLRAWKAWFPKAEIYGIDIHDKSYHEERRIRTFCGDQSDEAFLQSVLDEMGGVDIVIDDGSHMNRHILATFAKLFPALSEKGIYVVEDLQTSYWTDADGAGWDGSRDRDARDTAMGYFKSLVDGLNYEEFESAGYEPTYHDLNIVGMHFYHNMVFIEKGHNREGSTRSGLRKMAS